MGISVEPPGPADPVAPSASLSAQGAVTGPALGGAIATITAPPVGTYTVTVECYYSGTVAAVESDNISVQANAVVKGVISIPAIVATGSIVVTYTITVVIAAGNISVNAIAAGTGTAVYHASVVATKVG